MALGRRLPRSVSVEDLGRGLAFHGSRDLRACHACSDAAIGTDLRRSPDGNDRLPRLGAAFRSQHRRPDYARRPPTDRGSGSRRDAPGREAAPVWTTIAEAPRAHAADGDAARLLPDSPVYDSSSETARHFVTMHGESGALEPPVTDPDIGSFTGTSTNEDLLQDGAHRQ